MNPDWYADPSGQPFQRYWDGKQWTESTRAMPAYPSGYNATAPLPYLPPPPVQPKWYQRKGVLVAGGIVAALIVVSAIGSATRSGNDTPDADPAGQVQTESAQPSNAPTTPSPRETSSAPSRPSATPHVRRPQQPTHIGSFVMPNEVGQVLQDAQDDLQRLSHDPIFFSHSHDLLGDRFQILDRDWQVCSQNVAVGTTVSAIGHIDFGVVKTDESCP